MKVASITEKVTTQGFTPRCGLASTQIASGKIRIPDSLI